MENRTLEDVSKERANIQVPSNVVRLLVAANWQTTGVPTGKVSNGKVGVRLNAFVEALVPPDYILP